jgi:hypothetical protein
MKYLYLVDYWVPFPSSEYGGLVSVIADNDQECHDLLRDNEEYDDMYAQKIMERVVNASKFALLDEEESRIVESFTT